MVPCNTNTEWTNREQFLVIIGFVWGPSRTVLSQLEGKGPNLTDKGILKLSLALSIFSTIWPTLSVFPQLKLDEMIINECLLDIKLQALPCSIGSSLYSSHLFKKFARNPIALTVNSTLSTFQTHYATLK